MDTKQYILDKYNIPPKTDAFKIKDMLRKDLYVLYKELGLKLGAEIGVFRGVNAKIMFKTMPDLKLYCVDCWKTIPNSKKRGSDKIQQGNYRKMKVTLKRYIKSGRAEIVEKWSVDAAKDFENNSLDFVYIDADHRFDAVMQDIIVWSKKVRKGGIVSGHDFYKYKRFGVVPAVKTYVSAHRIRPLIILDDERQVFGGEYKKLRNKSKNSWLFVKEWED